MSDFFSTLPPDVLLEIAQYLDIESATRLFQTCQSLQKLSDYRPFWLDRLRRLMMDHSLPNRTFDIPSMTLAQLRNAVARPYRFERSLRQRKFTRLAPLQLGYGRRPVRAVHLVPGGRWLVVLWHHIGNYNDEANTTKSFVRVFDITHPAAGNFKLVAELSIPFTNRVALCVEPHPDGALICVSTVIGTSTVIYAVLFNDLDESLVKLGQQQLPMMLSHSPYLQGKFLAIILNDEHSVFVWNWTDNSKASLKTSGVILGRICSLQDEAIAFWDYGKRTMTVHGPIAPHLRDLHENPPVAQMSRLPIAPYAHPMPWSPERLETLNIPGSPTHPPAILVFMEDHVAHLILKPHDLVSPDIKTEGTIYMHEERLFSFDMKLPRIAQRTVNGYVVTISGSNELCIFDRTEDQLECQELFMDTPRHLIGEQFPFMCPVSGVLGSVSNIGQFYIWRGRDT